MQLPARGDRPVAGAGRGPTGRWRARSTPARPAPPTWPTARPCPTPRTRSSRRAGGPGAIPSSTSACSAGRRSNGTASPTEHAAWQRGRVRRAGVAPGPAAQRRSRRRGRRRLWPDLDAGAASRNLRVTLSHLLDVLDPDRERGTGSEVVVDAAGRLHLADVAWLRVDVRELEEVAGRPSPPPARATSPPRSPAARRLLGFSDGPLLGGATTGEWVEPVRRGLDDTGLPGDHDRRRPSPSRSASPSSPSTSADGRWPTIPGPSRRTGWRSPPSSPSATSTAPVGRPRTRCA